MVVSCCWFCFLERSNGNLLLVTMFFGVNMFYVWSFYVLRPQPSKFLENFLQLSTFLLVSKLQAVSTRLPLETAEILNSFGILAFSYGGPLGPVRSGLSHGFADHLI